MALAVSTTRKSGLIVPSGDAWRAYRDEDYERWINRQRAPFQAPFVRLPMEAALSHSTLVANFSSSNASSYNTASITPTANRLLIGSMSAYDATAFASPSITGNGLTWALIDTSLAPTGERVALFRAATGASPTAGAVTFSPGGLVTAAAWNIEQFDGYDTSGTNGSGAIVQSNKNNTASSGVLTVTLAALGSVNNGVWGVFANDTNGAGTVGGSYTKVSEQINAADGTTTTHIYKLPGTTTPNVSYGAAGICGLAIEIKAAGAATSALRFNSSLSGLGSSGPFFHDRLARSANRRIFLPSRLAA